MITSTGAPQKYTLHPTLSGVSVSNLLDHYKGKISLISHICERL
jgi:hypothetical protein